MMENFRAIILKQINKQYIINLERHTLVNLLHTWVIGTNSYFNMQSDYPTMTSAKAFINRIFNKV